ncbi:unnamed protein product [Debaryomyces tyrocola]|nr:unnamed protein product [Debaryomyces tyrocola]
MNPLKNKYTPLQRLVHQWKARRDIPFRKKFFIGYDLHGNTYWEFTVDGNMQRLRRKSEPYKPHLFKADYFGTIPPQWLQWLRRTRQKAPTLEELANDQLRQHNMKILAQQADEKWHIEKVRLEEEHKMKLAGELAKVEKENQEFQNKHKSEKQEDPWAKADAESKSDSSPIQAATINPTAKRADDQK